MRLFFLPRPAKARPALFKIFQIVFRQRVLRVDADRFLIRLNRFFPLLLFFKHHALAEIAVRAFRRKANRFFERFNGFAKLPFF